MNLLYELFSTVVNMSAAASVVAVIVMLIRLCLKRAPKIFSYVLWVFVFIRLILPFSFTSAYSVLNWTPAQINDHGQAQFVSLPDARTSVQKSDAPDTAPAVISEPEVRQSSLLDEENSVAKAPASSLSLSSLAAWVWLAGLTVYLLSLILILCACIPFCALRSVPRRTSMNVNR